MELGITERLAARAFLRLDLGDQERVLAQVERMVARGIRTEGKALAVLAAVAVCVAIEKRSTGDEGQI